ncbi:MAG: energy transducer TonB [Thermoanaerobaculia bacterium]
MFETVAPETFTKRSRRLFYETLPLSITVHAIAIAGAFGATAWNVVFPEHSPRLSATYSLTAIPDPPPPPPPPAPPKAQPQVVQPPIPDDKIVAPTVIPDTIPIVEKQQTVELTAAPQAVDNGVTGGVPGGIEGGSLGGEIGGKLGGVVGGLSLDGRVHIERDQKLPLVALSQDYPTYPDEGRLRGYEDALVVRYVIGKDGKVHEVKVIDPPKYPMFADAAVKAISRWRFEPFVEGGEKQEVVHELTVYFQLH